MGRPLPVCELASINGDILADGLGHDSFDPHYRAPFGAVPNSQGEVLLRFRTCRDDATRVRIRLWNSALRAESWLEMTKSGEQVQDPSLGSVEFWKASLQVPLQPTILYYFFEVTDQSSTHYYVSDPAPNGHGGWGRFSEHWNDFNTWAITVYDSTFTTPDWFKGSVMYQIFPDRFRNGETSNDPVTGAGYIFGRNFIRLNWNQPLCDPRGPECPAQRDNQFYGGDLQGVLERLDYLKELGTSVIYFNPIFLSSTNHRYDTQDYYQVDPELGSNEDFDRLLAEARKRGIRIILDGVFNHGSADSPYFDVFRRWDDTGACESINSQYRSWFTFPHVTQAPFDHDNPGNYYYCSTEDGMLTTYESWWGYYEHPVYQKNSPSIRNYFFENPQRAVGPEWISKGVAGWRLDVAGEIAPGQGVDPSNTFWQGFRKAIRAQSPDAVLIGEEWSNASPWLLGNEWDSATNYRFRSLLLNWLSDGCQGAGCTDGLIFSDANNNWGSANGPFIPLGENEFLRRLKVIEQDTPKEAWHAMMNPLSSHDTNRVLFVLKKTSRDDDALARRKLMLGTIFQFTYPGVPVIYYGDEAGVAAEARFHDGQWLADPYSRAVYPWADQGMTPDQELIAHFSRLGQIRNGNPALKRGDFEVVSVDSGRRLLVYTRKLPEFSRAMTSRRASASNQAWIALNRGTEPQACRFKIADPKMEGRQLNDLLNGGVFVVTGGEVDCGSLPGLWGRILTYKPDTQIKQK